MSKYGVFSDLYFQSKYRKIFGHFSRSAALWSKILLLPHSKPEDSFLKCDIPQSNCNAELFFRTKKLDKSELKATMTQYIRRSYERKAGAQRQFVESAVKRTQIKNSRPCTKK